MKILVSALFVSDVFADAKVMLFASLVMMKPLQIALQGKI